MIKKILATFYVLAISISSLLAQCATCKAAAETSLEDGNTTIASGINLGVIYMLSILFIIFGSFVFLVWKHRKADGSISK
ncbi:MAG: hypothetical protein ACPGVH_05600 [Chitinophagales bacterium]